MPVLTMKRLVGITLGGDTQEKMCPVLVRTASLETLQKADTRARQWKVAGSASQA
jgi:hypothetical protein